MPEPLGAVEVRVLGALMEKEATTPEYYPLSMNALVNACNQKSNRYPVVNYDEDVVSDAIEGLRAKNFAVVIVGNGRVKKYGQRISEVLNLGRRESAALCTLLLRGAQTLGEIKDRSERLFSFGDLEEADTTLERLSEWQPRPLVRKLPRQPGQKEARYAHLLAGEPAIEPESESPVVPTPSRLAQLEQQIEGLKTDVDELRRRFEELEAQFR